MKDRKKIEENHVTNNPFEAGRLSDAAQWLKMLSKEQMHLVVEIWKCNIYMIKLIM